MSPAGDFSSLELCECRRAASGQELGVPGGLPRSRPLYRRLLTSRPGRRAPERAAGRRLVGPEGGGGRAVPAQASKQPATHPEHSLPLRPDARAR